MDKHTISAINEETTKVRVQLLNENNEVEDVDVLTNADCVTFNDGETFQEKLDSGVLKGDKGDKGNQGVQGETGIQGIQGNQGIQGIQGETGRDGKDFRISHSFVSIDEMQTNIGTIEEGAFVIIATGNVEDEDNAKVYHKEGNTLVYIIDLSGSQGIKGETGAKGEQGIQGETGTQGIQGIQGVQGAKGEDGDKFKVGEDLETATVKTLFFKVVR